MRPQRLRSLGEEALLLSQMASRGAAVCAALPRSGTGDRRLADERLHGRIGLMVLRAGVRAELTDERCYGGDSIDLDLQVFADLEGGRRVLARPDGEPPRLMLGLRNVAQEERLQFVSSHLREAYLDPVSGDPVAWRALIATLGDEGLSCGVASLRALPFAVELGPRVRAALGER